MTFETRKAYSEIFAILQYMPQEYIEKIPNKVYKMFEKEKLEDYQIDIKKSNPLDKTILNKRTITLIAIINCLYWCPNKDVKNKLYKQYLANNKIYQREKEEKYNIDKLFKSNTRDNENEEIENIAIVGYKRQNLIKRIFNKIKCILKHN